MWDDLALIISLVILKNMIRSDILYPRSQLCDLFFDFDNVARFSVTIHLLIHFVFSRNLSLQPPQTFLYLSDFVCLVDV